MPDYRAIYMTAETEDEASRIGRALVEDRLVACVNIIKDMRSLYWWDGNVQEANEVIMIAKTHRDRVPAVVERVKALHAYDCPCVVSYALQDGEGNGDYLQWIAAETKVA